MNSKCITEVILHNYRGYKHTVIPMTPGLNVIYGEGDAGKSALEKALRWCLLNEKQGKFINKKITTKGGKIKSSEEVYVQVTFNDGGAVRRGADSSTPNLYWTGKVDTPFEEWGKPLKNFKDVPEAVLKVINLSSVNVGKQFDSHFLLSSKGSDIAKDLNKTVNLEVIDSSQSNAKHFVTKVKREKETAEFNLNKYEKDLESYSYLEKMGIALDVVEGLEKNITTNKDGQREVGVLLNTLDESDEKMSKFVDVVSFKKQIEAVQELTNKVDSLSKDREAVKAAVSQVAQNGDYIAKYQKATAFKETVSGISVIEKQTLDIQEDRADVSNLLSSAEINEKLGPLLDKIAFLNDVEDLQLLSNKIRDLNEDYDFIQTVLDKVEASAKLIEEKQKEVAEMKENLTGVCPTCGRAFDECGEAV